MSLLSKAIQLILGQIDECFCDDLVSDPEDYCSCDFDYQDTEDHDDDCEYWDSDYLDYYSKSVCDNCEHREELYVLADNFFEEPTAALRKAILLNCQEAEVPNLKVIQIIEALNQVEKAKK